MQREWSTFLKDFSNSSILEISPGERTIWQQFGRSYRSTQYPAFDICAETTPQRYDIIIADNVFEHLADPYAAAGNVFSMLNPGGWFVIATPFLVRLHGCPSDFTRWTPEGMRRFLTQCGFNESRVDSWGNRACIKANYVNWAPYGWGKPLHNEPEFPMMVWAFARKD